MGNKKIRLVANQRDAGKSARLDAGTDQAGTANWRLAGWGGGGRAGLCSGVRLERGLWVLDYSMGQRRHCPYPNQELAETSLLARCPVCK